MPHAGAVLEAVFVAALALGGFAFARRYGGGAALEQLERANRILEETVEKQAGMIARLQTRVAELEGKTDLTIALVPVLTALGKHEDEAGKRSDAMLGVLHMIANRLGPEPA